MMYTTFLLQDFVKTIVFDFVDDTVHYVRYKNAIWIAKEPRQSSN